MSKQSEKSFQADVIQLATLTGWQVYHAYDSRRSQPGWLDLVLCKPPKLMLRELKVPPNKLTPEQVRWIALLKLCGIDAGVWTPDDWPAIEAELGVRRR